jgi:hypothetical protein
MHGCALAREFQGTNADPGNTVAGVAPLKPTNQTNDTLCSHWTDPLANDLLNPASALDPPDGGRGWETSPTNLYRIKRQRRAPAQAWERG